MLKQGKNYPLVVKLGTITKDGADVYSYAADEDRAVIDPYLATHLAQIGINIMALEKTEKTAAEIE
jgi:ubiquitin carboxyl-terminal hydrolase 5/13